jgi:tRNA-Thr(GGU) m(6)t(6)A37 methyltransferase TsaA
MDSTLTLQPVGYIRSEKTVKFHAPHQPAEDPEERSVLELLPGHAYEQALQDLSGFTRIWLVWWFHRNIAWRPLVQPPRGPVKKRGVFATRSPRRPNPLGLTCVQLISVEGRRLILGPCDLLDGTPVFDIKPYIAEYDSFPDASAGWTGEVAEMHLAPPAFEVRISPLAAMQAQWLSEVWEIDFRPRMAELLARDPTPHRTRRIKRRGRNQWMIGCGAWRGVFTVEDRIVNVVALEPGYPLRFLTDPERGAMPDKDAQLAFLEYWPEAEPVD